MFRILLLPWLLRRQSCQKDNKLLSALLHRQSVSIYRLISEAFDSTLTPSRLSQKMLPHPEEDVILLSIKVVFLSFSNWFPVEFCSSLAEEQRKEELVPFPLLSWAEQSTLAHVKDNQTKRLSEKDIFVSAWCFHYSFITVQMQAHITLQHNAKYTVGLSASSFKYKRMNVTLSCLTE